jgi:hypothetical protein
VPHLTQGTVTAYWMLVWLTAGFGIPETVALTTGHPEYTLSETAWRMLDVIPGRTVTQWSFLHLIVSVLLFWLWLHISFRIWT